MGGGRMSPGILVSGGEKIIGGREVTFWTWLSPSRAGTGGTLNSWRALKHPSATLATPDNWFGRKFARKYIPSLH
jgi:hypothetical protein